jgi:hypothetical protein
VEDVYWDDYDSELRGDVEHPNAELAADIYLARVQIPAIEGPLLSLNTSIAPVIQNDGRRMVYSTADFAALNR